MLKQIIAQIIMLTLLAGAALAAPLVAVDPERGLVTLTNDADTKLAAVAVDISYDPTLLETPSALAGPAAIRAEKKISVVALAPGLLRVALFGYNADEIGAGEVILLKLAKKLNAPAEGVEVTCRFSASSPDATEVVLNNALAAIRVK